MYSYTERSPVDALAQDNVCEETLSAHFRIRMVAEPSVDGLHALRLIPRLLDRSHEHG